MNDFILNLPWEHKDFGYMFVGSVLALFVFVLFLSWRFIPAFSVAGFERFIMHSAVMSFLNKYVPPLHRGICVALICWLSLGMWTVLLLMFNDALVYGIAAEKRVFTFWMDTTIVVLVAISAPCYLKNIPLFKPAAKPMRSHRQRLGMAIKENAEKQATMRKREKRPTVERRW